MEGARRIRHECDSLNTGLLTVKELSTRRLCILYFVTSYIYYQLDDEILKDALYESICLELLTRNLDEDILYERPENDSLRAGTGYNLRYSNQIQALATQAIN